MIERAADISLQLSSRAENVRVVRALLRGLGEGLGLSAELQDDVRTAVSEAANNVVFHAYPQGEGSMEVDVHVAGGHLVLAVRDRGRGMSPAANTDGADPGLGLAVMGACAERVELVDLDPGTEVRLAFPLPIPLGSESPPAPAPDAARATASDAVVVSLAAGPLAAPVLAQVTAALAVQARFPVDRLGDAHLLAGTVAAEAVRRDPARRLTVSLHPEPRRLQVEVGPVPPGQADRLAEALAAAEIRQVAARLLEQVRVQPVDGGELVHVSLADRRS